MMIDERSDERFKYSALPILIQLEELANCLPRDGKAQLISEEPRTVRCIDTIGRDSGGGEDRTRRVVGLRKFIDLVLQLIDKYNVENF
jgi:hypothetical protein